MTITPEQLEAQANVSPELLEAIRRTNDVQARTMEIVSRISQMIDLFMLPGRPQMDRKTVATAGTAEKLVSSPRKVKWVVFSVGTITSFVAIGTSSSVSVTAGSERGITLSSLGMLGPLYNVDLSNFWINSDTNGEGVQFLYALD